MLVQIKVTKTKDTLSCADATHRCPARLRPKEDSRKLAALRATQTSVCLFLFRPPLLGATPKGTEYRLETGSLSLRNQDRRAILVGQCRRRVRPERSQTLQRLLDHHFNYRGSVVAPVFGSRVARREAQGRRVSGALRRCGQLSERRQSDASLVN